MKTTLQLLLMVLWFNVSLNAQNIHQTVRGTIVDAFTGAPIAGAQIVILETNPLVGTTSNTQGEFELKNIKPGRWSFSAGMMGFKPSFMSNIMVLAGKETTLNFKLEEKMTSLGTVEVKPNFSKEKPLNEMALISARSFSVEETERFAGSLGDPARMVSNFAGVTISNDTRNDIIIRGNSPIGLLWRIEGVDVPNPNHFGAQGTTGGPVSMLNNNLLSNSDFLTSAFPAEYGNATSGVFDLNLRSGNKQKYEFTGQIGFNGFELAAEGPVSFAKNNPKGSFILDYRYSTLQLMSKLGFNVGTGSAIPQYNDLSMILDLPTKGIGRFKFVGIFGNSFIRLNRTFNINEATTHSQIGYATDFGAGLNLGILTHTIFLNEKTKLKSSFSFQSSNSNTVNDTIDYTNKKYFTNYAGKLFEKKEVLSTVLKHKFGPDNNLSAGISTNRFITSFNDSVFLKEQNKYISLTDVNNQPSILYEAFANWQHKFSDRFVINTGFHYQYYDLSEEHAIEPRLSAKYHLSEGQSINLGYGLHTQIQPRTVYFYKEYNKQTGVYSETNRNLKSNRSNQLVLGYDLLFTKQFRFKAETYYQQLFNAAVSASKPEFSLLNSGSGYFIQRFDSLSNVGKGKNYGIELTLEKFLSDGYYGLLTVSLYDSKYTGYDKVWRNTAFNSNYAINMLAGYEWKLGKNNFLTCDLRTVWSGGIRFIPIDLNASIAAGEQVLDASKSYENRYNDYFRTDIRIGFKQNMGKFSQEFGLDLQNITNHQNLYGEQYNNQLRKITQIYQQGFMPMMLYRVNF